MRVLVVGATGQTGRLIVEELHGAGHAVRAFARSVTEDAVPEGVEVQAGDVCDPYAVAAAVQGMEAVIVADRSH